MHLQLAQCDIGEFHSLQFSGADNVVCHAGVILAKSPRQQRVVVA